MNYKLDINTTEKLLDAHFADDFLPTWYFFSTTPEDITNHIMIISQLLDANHEYLQQMSSVGREITYFVNVGQDFPGRLAKIIRENQTTGIQAYDSVKTKSGIRIITIEIPGRPEIALTCEEKDGIEQIKERTLSFGMLNKYAYTRDFLSCLPLNYYYEEFTTFVLFRRILRHLRVYEQVRHSPTLVIRTEDVIGSVRAEKISSPTNNGLGLGDSRAGTRLRYPGHGCPGKRHQGTQCPQDQSICRSLRQQRLRYLKG